MYKIHQELKNEPFKLNSFSSCRLPISDGIFPVTSLPSANNDSEANLFEKKKKVQMNHFAQDFLVPKKVHVPKCISFPICVGIVPRKVFFESDNTFKVDSNAISFGRFPMIPLFAFDV